MGLINKLLCYQRKYGSKYVLRKVYNRLCIKYYLGGKYFPCAVTETEREKQTNWKPVCDKKISLVVPLYNTAESFLRQLINSVQSQTYANWELCLVDASDENQLEIEQMVRDYIQQDERIRYCKLSQNQGISENTNRGLEMATGDYMGLLDHDDILHPCALFYVMQEIDKNHADFVYTDELSFVNKTSQVQSIHLKPDFSTESFRSNNYICHFSVFDKKLLEQVGGFRREFDGSQDYDLFLRLTEQAKKVCHVARVLYYWRVHAGSVASEVGAKPYTIEAGKKALEEHLERERLQAEVSASEYGTFYHIHYKVAPENKIVIFTQGDTMTSRVMEQCRGLPYTIMVTSQEALAKMTSDDWLSWDYVIFLREGYQPLQEKGEWITELLECLQPKENLVAAPIVYDAAGKVYHAGYCYDTAFIEKIRPLYRGVPQGDPAYMNRLAFRQNVSLLGGAALAVKTQTIQQVWNNECEKNDFYQTVFSDVFWFSVCLSAKGQKGNCIMTPNVAFRCGKVQGKELLGSKSISGHTEWKQFWKKWEDVLRLPDPHFNSWMLPFGKKYFLWDGRGNRQ